MSQTPAGEFEAHVPPDFDKQNHRILYIGKATSGAFDQPDDAANAFGKINSPFWHFAKEVSMLGGATDDTLSNVMWSNIFKVGVTVGNPTGAAAEVQRAEAPGKLRDEASKLKPADDLILLVNVGYEETIVKLAFDIADGETETPNDGKLHEIEVTGEKIPHLDASAVWWFSCDRLDEPSPVQNAYVPRQGVTRHF